MQEFSMLIYLAVKNNKDITKVMHKWNGGDYNYSLNDIKSYVRNTVSDICRNYHIKNFMCNYLDFLNTYEKYESICNKNNLWVYDKETDALIYCLKLIRHSVIFSKEDLDMMEEIKKEYIDSVENKQNV